MAVYRKQNKSIESVPEKLTLTEFLALIFMNLYFE